MQQLPQSDTPDFSYGNVAAICPACGSRQDDDINQAEESLHGRCWRCWRSLAFLDQCRGCEGLVEKDWLYCVWCQSPIDYLQEGRNNGKASLDTPNRDGLIRAQNGESVPLIALDTPMLPVFNVDRFQSVLHQEMEFFEIVKEAFNRRAKELADNENRSLESVIENGLQFVRKLHRTYLADDYRRPASYAEPYTRLAYLIYSTASNAFLTDYSIRKDEYLSAYLYDVANNSGQLRICTLGGGPGSEILGIVRWIIRQNFSRRIIVTPQLTDKQVTWAWEWEALRYAVHEWMSSTISPRSEEWPVFIDVSPLADADIRDLQTFAKFMGSVPSQDLFVISYAVSEIYQQNSFEGTHGIFEELAGQASNDAKFLFIDRSQREIRETVQRIVDISGMKFVGLKSHNIEKVWMSSDKCKQHLGVIYDQLMRLGNSNPSPRLGGRFFWSVAGKEG